MVGFKKIKFFTNENVGAGKLELPENEMHTTSFWITSGPAVSGFFAIFGFGAAGWDVWAALRARVYGGVAVDVRPARFRDGDWGTAARCRALGRIGLQRLPWSRRTDWLILMWRAIILSLIFICTTAYPGGIGFSEPLFRAHEILLRRTRELISACGCEEGCPSCVGPVGDKAVAMEILTRILA